MSRIFPSASAAAHRHYFSMGTTEIGERGLPEMWWRLCKCENVTISCVFHLQPDIADKRMRCFHGTCLLLALHRWTLRNVTKSAAVICLQSFFSAIPLVIPVPPSFCPHCCHSHSIMWLHQEPSQNATVHGHYRSVIYCIFLMFGLYVCLYPFRLFMHRPRPKQVFAGKSTELIVIFNHIWQIWVMLKYFKYKHIIRCKIIMNLLRNN